MQRARVDTEVRALADEASAGLGRPWAASVRRASTSRLDDLGDRLDAALASTDLQVDRLPWWTGVVRALQWLLLAAGVGGLAWLLVLAVLGFLGLPDVATPSVGGLPVPTVLLLGGVLLGIVLGLAGRVLVAATARSRARGADSRLRGAVSEVASELVVAPVSAELAAHAQVREALATIRRS